MIMGRFSTRTVLFTSVIGLVATVAGGGILLSVTESRSLFDGIWLAFNVVTATGFGSGPETVMGQVLSIALFIAGASCWFGVLLVGTEVANMRFQKHSLIDEALRPLARRPRNRLFHLN